MLTELELHTIRLDGGTQTRAVLNQGVVNEYAAAMEEGEVFPPLVVFKDEEGVLWLAEGFHRHAGYLKAGILMAPCEVREGSQREALEHALGSNAAHGLRRTHADKRRAVELCIADPEWAKLSVQQIAEKCRVGWHLVDEMVRKANPQATERKSADGKVYPVAPGEKAKREVRAREPREPGDESEHEPAPSTAVSEFFNSKPAKRPRTHFDDSQFDRLIGPVVRFVQARAEHLKCVGCPEQKRIEGLLDDVIAEFHNWQRRVAA